MQECHPLTSVNETEEVEMALASLLVVAVVLIVALRDTRAR
jgi:hypothetical protein